MKKLNLKKKIIAKLSDQEQLTVKGGLAITTSFSACTHFLCCGPGCPPPPSTLQTDCGECDDYTLVGECATLFQCA
jgi:hypothetical protein